MTGKDSVAYMKEKGYYKGWILPELDLMEEAGGIGGKLSAYRGRPVGNHPEVRFVWGTGILMCIVAAAAAAHPLAVCSCLYLIGNASGYFTLFSSAWWSRLSCDSHKRL